MSEFVSIERDGAVAIIRIDRPKMNPLNLQVQRELLAAAHEVSEDADVRAVVFWGGERVFAAGADIKEMQDMSYTDMAAAGSHIQAFTKAIAAIPKPTIAAVTGYALGAGFEVAVACDFRVLADNGKVGLPEILLGVIPGAGGTQRLARLVGPARAKELIFSGRFVDADEALAVGMVDKVVPAADVYAEALAWAHRYDRSAPFALRAAKEAVDRGLEVDLDTGLEIERMLFASLFATHDRSIGMESFVANGPGKAEFTGS